MTLSAADRAAISRHNGQKSNGPKSSEGKDRSRFNALKHGLKAKVPVLPGEDPQEYQGRLQAWIADLQPKNDVEHTLVERAVTITWQLDRADRAETARLTTLIREAPAETARRQEDEAAALGRRLFFDRRGPVPLYPHSLYGSPDRPRVSASGLSDDPDDPPRLLLRLEATASGCRWLLDRWAELRALLDGGLSWQPPDKLRAIRLLGHQPLDAADSQVVATIFQACHVLDPQPYHQAGVVRGGEAETLAAAVHTLETVSPGLFARPGDPSRSHDTAEPDPDPDCDEDPNELDVAERDEDEDTEAQVAWQGCGAAFTELMSELTAEEARAYRRRLEGRRLDQLRPRDPAAARTTLRALVEQAVIRLQAKLEVHEANAPLAAAEAVDRLGFDESVEGERLRRFQLASQRALLRTIDSLKKLRRTGPSRQAISDPLEPADPGATVAGLSATIWCSLEGIHSSLGDDLRPAGPALPVGLPSAPEPEPEPEHVAQNASNEPTGAGADPPIAPADSPAAGGDPRISPNEPTASAGEHPIIPHEPPLPAVDPAPQQEPVGVRRLDNPPPASAAIGKATDVGTVAAAPPPRGTPGDDSVPAARQGRPQAGAGERPGVEKPHLPGRRKSRGDSGA